MVEELASVERVPRALFLKTVVCAQIHHHGIRVKLGGQCSGSAMRQCQDDHVMAVQHFGGGVLHRQIRQLGNMRHMRPSFCPTEEWPATQVTSKSGWAARMRNASPPAYPVAPATATVYLAISRSFHRRRTTASIHVMQYIAYIHSSACVSQHTAHHTETESPDPLPPMPGAAC